VDGGGRDAVRCGRGDADLVNADLEDGIAGDCETVARVVARDPYGAPAQHATIAEPDTFAHGGTVVAAYQVGRFRDGGAVSIGWATSADAGRTWRSGILPSLTVASEPGGPWQRASDPVVAYDSVHGVWLIASLAFTPRQATAVVVSRSTDGRVWSPPVTVVERPSRPDVSLDKEWIVCDGGRASPHRGSCYVGYSALESQRMEFQASRNGGLTWDAPVAAPDNAGRSSIRGRWAPAPQPVVQPDGDLIVPYYDETRVAAVRSSDGGRSFSSPVTVSPTAFKPTPGLRAPPLPSAEVDRLGTIYVAWPDCRSRPSCGQNDLVLARSEDGISWSTRRIPVVARSSANDVVIPGLGVDPTRVGRLVIAYYVLRPGALLDVGVMWSRNGGRTWTLPRRLNAQTMRLGWIARAGGAMVGDYISTSFSGGHAVAAFALASPAARFDQPLFTAVIR
jgi:hypothetical protein